MKHMRRGEKICGWVDVGRQGSGGLRIRRRMLVGGVLVGRE